MALTHTAMRGMNICCTFSQMRALCPLLSSLHHPALFVHIRNYKRPGSSLKELPFWKRRDFSFKTALKNLKSNFNLLLEEMKDHLRAPPLTPLKEVHMTVVWAFRSSEDLEKWQTTTDKEIGGKSEAFLKLGRNERTALFYGVLNTEVPRDGETNASGYCALRSRPIKMSFGGKHVYDWLEFNTLHLRVRGDGRPWMLSIQSHSYLTTTENDLYNYFLFTHGGPYWQDIKIPFSKLFLSSRGRVLDAQFALMPDKITTLALTLADQTDGPFQLEIDFIGVCKDHTHTEEFAYEKYESVPL